MRIYLKGWRPHQSECGQFESGKLHWIQQEAIVIGEDLAQTINTFYMILV